jgi:hypothetical protein
VGGLILVVFFFFPETAYKRVGNPLVERAQEVQKQQEYVETPLPPIPKKESYVQTLRLWSGQTYTDEPFWRMFARPFGLILLPPVFWATIVMSVTIGFLVAVTSNFASAFNTVYGFEPWQSGLCFLAGMVGCLFGTFVGGPFSDWVADYFTKHNGGIREPEMRLPAIIPSVIAATLALLLYGFGVANAWHWMVPTVGLGLCMFSFHLCAILVSAIKSYLTWILIVSFAISQGTNVSFVYCIDCFRPVAGEVTVTQLAFKCQYEYFFFPFCIAFIDSTTLQNLYKRADRILIQLASVSSSPSTRIHGSKSQDTPPPMAPWLAFPAVACYSSFPFSFGGSKSGLHP